MRRLVRSTSALLLLLICAVILHAQTTITASHEKIANFPVNGTVYFTAVDSRGVAIPFADSTGAQNGPYPFGCALVNGAITGAFQADGTVSGTCAIPDSATTTPAVLYTADVCSTAPLIINGKTLQTACFELPKIAGITGATFALDHYGPPATTPSGSSSGSSSSSSGNATTVNGAAVPASQGYVGTNAQGQFVAAATPAGGGSATAVTTATCSSAYALAFATSGDITYDLTLSANCALTVVAPSTTGIYRRITLIIRPAGFQATLPASSSALAWAGGTAPVPSTSAVTVITFGSTGVAPVFGGI